MDLFYLRDELHETQRRQIIYLRTSVTTNNVDDFEGVIFRNLLVRIFGL